MTKEETDTDRAIERLDVDALPTEVERPISPEPLTYAPWHKPRKQLVRRSQWAREVRDLIGSLRTAGDLQSGTFRYLTLPGPDLLDVRVLAKVCQENDASLNYLGLCRDREERQAQLRRNISSFSEASGDVLPYTFEALATRSGTAMHAVRRRGAFHAINVDACQPLANRDPNETGRIIDAVKTVIEHQLNKVRHRWLLFVTTVVQPDSVSNNSLETLRAEIKKNAKESDDFAAQAINAIDNSSKSLETAMHIASKEIGEPFARLFSLGIAKWLIRLCESHSYSVFGRTPLCYSTIPVAPHPANMISLCFEFRPNPVALLDSSGLTSTTELSVDESTIPADIRAVSAVEKTKNLDELLKSKPKLASELITETMDLLRQVGYPVDDPVKGYDAWLKTQPLSGG